MGLSNLAGSIALGKKADFMVLKEDIFKLDAYDISTIKPLKVYFKGQKLTLNKK